MAELLFDAEAEGGRVLIKVYVIRAALRLIVNEQGAIVVELDPKDAFEFAETLTGVATAAAVDGALSDGR